MKQTRLIWVVVLGLAGLLWIGQGFGLVPGSFMTGNSFWAWMGAMLLMVAGLVWWRAR